MDIHAALEEVTRWCAHHTEASDPDAMELECHATVWITIGESAPPWRVRLGRASSAGASAPVAQLRYDAERREWALDHRGPESEGWCRDDDAARAPEIAALLRVVAGDRRGRFQGLPPGFRWHEPLAAES